VTDAAREIIYLKPALAFLAGLPKKQRRQIIEKTARLALDPCPPGSLQLQNAEHEGIPVRRIRQGAYRVLYVERESKVLVLDIDHRKDVYR
jgi:mRNA-degrading endonuclease RelE of RelBE toxin-antitoxin system